MPGGADFVGEEPVAELRILAVGVQDGVGQVGVAQRAWAHGLVPPAAIGLAGELQDPTRDRHRDRIDLTGGKLAHERVEPFPGSCACDK